MITDMNHASCKRSCPTRMRQQLFVPTLAAQRASVGSQSIDFQIRLLSCNRKSAAKGLAV